MKYQTYNKCLSYKNCNNSKEVDNRGAIRIKQGDVGIHEYMSIVSFSLTCLFDSLKKQVKYQFWSIIFQYYFILVYQVLNVSLWFYMFLKVLFLSFMFTKVSFWSFFLISINKRELQTTTIFLTLLKKILSTSLL